MALENRLLGDIQNWFDDFAVKLTDLQKPTYVFVRDFYCRALMEFEVDTDNVRRAVGLASDTEVDIAGDINLVAAVNRVFPFLDFGLFDLLSPTDNQRRTVSLMSKMIEFISMADDLTSKLDFDTYRDWRGELQGQKKQLEDLKTKVSEVALDKDRLEQENIKIQQMILAAKKKKEEEAKVVSSVEAEANAAQRNVQTKKAEFETLTDQVEKTKITVLRLRDELQGAQSLESREEEKKSSEQEKADLHMKYKEKSELKKNLALALDSIKKHRSLLLELGKAVDDCKAMQDSLTAVQKEVAELKQAAASEQKNLAAWASEEAALEQKEKQIAEEFAAFKSEYEGKIAELTKKSSVLLATVASTEKDMASEDWLWESIKKTQKEEEERFKEYASKLLKLMRYNGRKLS